MKTFGKPYNWDLKRRIFDFDTTLGFATNYLIMPQTILILRNVLVYLQLSRMRPSYHGDNVPKMAADHPSAPQNQKILTQWLQNIATFLQVYGAMVVAVVVVRV